MFLDQNPQINNRLACLVRDLLELPYLKVVFLVFAALGLQVVEPFYCKTIDKFATHSNIFMLAHNEYHITSNIPLNWKIRIFRENRNMLVVGGFSQKKGLVFWANPHYITPGTTP